MLHNTRFAFAALLFAAAPLHAQTALDQARVEVLDGRAVLIGGGADVQTVRRTETVRAQGATQVEIGAGSRVHIGFDGTLSLDVHGPASFQWSADGAQVKVSFGELGWADVEARRGEHVLDLPSDWRATIGRSSVHLRGIAGGPTELRLDAGQPAVVDWRGGGRTEVRPPVAVFPGSSVRLDRPRNTPVEPRRDERDLAWSSGTQERDEWPWRASGGGDTARDIQERQTFDSRTQSFDELPGASYGSIDRVRSAEGDGSFTMRELPRFEPAAPQRDTEPKPAAPVVSDDTSAQVSLTPKEVPTVEVIERSTLAQRPRVDSVDEMMSSGSNTSLSEPRVQPRAELERSRAVAPAPELRASSVAPFDTAQWRGIERSKLNGAGVVAAERGTGVEFRILGGGRTKVLVSGSSPAPRWCFTPQGDYLMHPGALAVFEKDGAMRMSFGTVEAFDRVANRPKFSEL